MTTSINMIEVLSGSGILVTDALEFAIKAHAGQKRKYTGEPYINHPIEVAAILRKRGSFTNEVIAAALLHDVVEDTDVTLEQIAERFGLIVAEFVYAVTDVAMSTDGNRAAREAINRAHLDSNCCWESLSIKAADVLSNTREIYLHDPKFAKVYIPEKRLLWTEVLNGSEADPKITEALGLQLTIAELHLSINH